MNEMDMDEIIPGLYVGGWGAARDIKARGLPIHIVTVAIDSQVVGDWHVKLIDGPGNSERDFMAAVHYVCEYLLAESPVLVHCIAGRSRSAAVAVGALMRVKAMSLCEAYDLVKSKRNIQVHPAFARLMEAVTP